MGVRLGAIGTGGNLTTAATWGTIDALGSVDSEAGTLTITTSTSTHIASSIGARVVTTDGVYLKISSKVSSGTFTVVWRNLSTSTDVTSVTVNVADLPRNGWCFFKWSSSQTTNGTDVYSVRVTCSVASQVILYRATFGAQEFTRLFRTTTTAAPAAAGQMIICKELTGAGTDNGTCTVTMDNTAATVFGDTSSYSDAIGVGHGGVLDWGTTASTNYLLTVSGLITIWDGGTWNRGTSGTRMPSTSTAVLKLSVAINVDSGFRVPDAAVATVNDYGTVITTTGTLMTVSRGGYVTTSGTAVTRVSGQSFTGLTGTIVINSVSYTISSVTNSSLLVLTGSAGNQSSPVTFTHPGTATTLTVASTSGWAANDLLGIASTSRSANNCEQVTISSVDSATQVTLSSALTWQHSGDSPTQAEVIHLTRNVRTEGTSTSLQGYVYYGTTGIVNDSYCSFRYLGSNTTGKRGINVMTTTGSYTAVGCTVTDGVVSGSSAWYISGSTVNNISITYCSTYTINTYPLNVPATSGTNITVSYFIAMVSTSAGLNLADVGITLTNLTVVGCASSGAIAVAESATVTGTISNLTAHSNNNTGITVSGINFGTLTNLTAWRNGSTGFDNNGNAIFTVDGLTTFGNSGNSISSASGAEIVFIDVVSSGDIVFSTSQGFTANGFMTFYNSTFGVAAGIKTAHSLDVYVAYVNVSTRTMFVNCILASATEVSGQSSMPPNSFIYSQNHDQAGGVRRWGKYGTANLDTVTYRTASPSQTLTPNNASGKLVSDDTQPIVIDNGQTATVTVYVYKSAAYNGNQPRLIVRRNDAIGITSDTVLATASGGTGSWLTLSGTTAAATADGAFVCYVDCDGTAGTCSVDDWSVA